MVIANLFFYTKNLFQIVSIASFAADNVIRNRLLVHNKMMKWRRDPWMKLRSIGTKISLIVITVLLLFSSAVIVVVIQQMKKGIETFAMEKAKSDLELGWDYLEHKYPGDWSIKNGQLYKGTTLINENYSIVDELGTMTGDTVTIFQADKRVATNVMNDGQRAVGTKVSDSVRETVLVKGGQYYGKADVVGKSYQTAYRPIQNGENEIIGIFYVGASQDLIDVLVSSFVKNFLWMIVAAVLLALAVVLVFIRRLTRRIGGISSALQRAGGGDFTVEVNDASRDEIGDLVQSYNQMKSSLQRLIRHGFETATRVVASTHAITEITQQTAAESNQIAKAIGEVARGAEIQTQSSTENLKAMEELSAGVQRFAESASEISESAQFSRHQAESGGELLQHSVKQMDSISLSAHETDEVIRSLEQKSHEIAGILEGIRAVSEQTNLLALNASIEAAKAGEQGRGFAVVASEVRKLADQSGRSSARIEDLIVDLQDGMNHSVQSIARMIQEVEQGIRIAQKTESSFKEILTMNAQIGAQIEEMAAASEQMSAGIEQVTASVTNITEIARTTSTSSRQVAASTSGQLEGIGQISLSADALSKTSAELEQSLGQFKI